MKHPDVTEVTCPCGAIIKYHKAEPPQSCVVCYRNFVASEDVVILEGVTPPTVVKVMPIKGEFKGAN